MSKTKMALRILALLVLLACMPAMALAEQATINKNTSVYQKPDTDSASVKVKKGMKVDVVAVDGKWAMIENSGNHAFINTKYLDVQEDEKEEEKKEGSSSVEMYDDPVKAEISENTRVYQKPDTDSASVKVKKGMDVKVLGVSGSWALIENKGNRAYIRTKYLDMNPSSDEKEEEEAKEQPKSFKEIYASGKYSNEELIYAYAVKEMGYNSAAAAGLLANIRAESNFNVNANGDSGRSYGICQWFSARRTRLLDWCAQKGYDPATLYGQLRFLEYELETYYPSVHRYMKNVPDTAEGAYDAAYYFCYNFEAPANKASKSASRGSSAQNTYFPKYETVEI